MKYVLVLLVVLVFGWLLLRGRGRSKASRDAQRKEQAQSMIECAHCGVHLPRSDAVLDRNGSYCCDAHKMAGPRGP